MRTASTNPGMSCRRASTATFKPRSRAVFEVKDTEYGCMIGAKRPEQNGRAYWRITQWLLPVHTLIGVASLAFPEMMVETDVTAITPD